MRQPENLNEPDWRLDRREKERRKSVRLQNLLKWSLAFLIALSGYFIRGWYEEVNYRLTIMERSYIDDHTELKVLTERTKSIDERVSDVDAKMDLVLDKLDKIKEQTR
jgi:cell division protein FtsB